MYSEFSVQSAIGGPTTRALSPTLCAQRANILTARVETFCRKEVCLMETSIEIAPYSKDVMVTASSGEQMTAEELLRLQDDGHRYELVQGELKVMTPASP